MIPVIVSARMNSRRLPGKSMRPIAGKPLLQWTVEALQRVSGEPPVILATSVEPSDDPIADWCAQRSVQCYRGPLDDLASRFIEAARSLGAEAFVRISGDSPLIDPALVAHAIALFRTGEVDVVSNVQERTFPKGCSVEVIRVEALEDHLRRHGEGDDREHVTPVLYRHPASLRIVSFTSGGRFGLQQLSVDTEDDLRHVEEILRQVGGSVFSLGWKGIVQRFPRAAD